MPNYQDNLRDPRWQKRRLEVLDSAGFKCEDCGCRDRELHVHHCAYAAGKLPWEYGPELLMSLCRECHERRQRLEDATRISIGEITRFLSPADLESECWAIVDEMAKRQTARYAEVFA